MPVKKDKFYTAFSEYTVVDVIGSGGSGIVYRVRDESGAVYALKSVDPSKANHQRIKRFENELHFCLKTEHPNIVKVLDWGYTTRNDTKLPFYVMPYYSETLRSLMKAGIDAQNVLPLFSQVLDGTECVHLSGVVHRDLKPENILVDPTKRLLVLGDFGIAHFSEEELHTAVETRATERLANFQYAAPEQRTKGCKVDSRADIYSLGLILNEMLTGQCPLGTEFKRIAAVAPALAYLDNMVELMIRQDPEARPQGISRVKDLLIQKQNDFIVHQRVDALKKQVVPTSEEDDPLVLVSCVRDTFTKAFEFGKD